MSSMEISNLTKETLRKMFAEGKRFDSRGLLDFRGFEITYDVSNKAEGSSRVRLGKTDVIVGIKMGFGEPYPDSPDKGNLAVSGDLLPLASPRFESGPPGFDSIELLRLVDRAIRESGMIEFEKLVMKKGEKVWTINIDIYPINDDGNLIDAATIGAVAALKKCFIPEINSEEKIDYEKVSIKKLPLSKETFPLSISFYKIGDSIILDPTREEEEASDAKITLGISKRDGEHMVNSCQKKGEMPFTSDEIEKMMEILPKKFEEINKKLKNFL